MRKLGRRCGGVIGERKLLKCHVDGGHRVSQAITGEY